MSTNGGNIIERDGFRWKRLSGEDDELTFDEMELLEDVTGLTFGQVEERAALGSIKALRGILFVLIRREMPDVAYADLGRLKASTLADVVSEEAADPPTVAPATNGHQRSSRSTASGRGKSAGSSRASGAASSTP